jgi:hypothetical protein
VSRLGRVVAVVAILGSLLLLSACGTSGQSAAGSYWATFHSPSADSTFPLTLSSDKAFALKLGSGHAIRGTWSEHGDNLTLTGSDGAAHVVLNIQQFGKSLGNSGSHMGVFEALGQYSLKDLPKAPWYATRI